MRSPARKVGGSYRVPLEPLLEYLGIERSPQETLPIFNKIDTFVLDIICFYSYVLPRINRG